MTTAVKSKDAIALLKADHKKVKDLFDQFEKTDDISKKKKIADEAMKELRVHAIIEEEIFYPAIREAIQQEEGKEGKVLMDEAEEEHRVAKTLIEELCAVGSKDDHFEAKFTVLAENVRHHIKEEEGEIFPDVRDIDSLDLKDLGQELESRKEQLLQNEDELDQADKNSQVKPYQELAHNN